MYLMISTYTAPLDQVNAAREDHLAYLDTLAERGLLIEAGRRDPVVGGIVVLAAESEDEARTLINDDPYVQRGLAAYEAVGWTPNRGPLANWKKP
jgi:uncharacterized protein YciI